MYVHGDVAAQMHAETLERAQQNRNAYRIRALHRARRRADRAEQRMSQAHRDVHRLRLELEAER